MGEERVIKATLAAAMGSESDKAVLTSSLGDPTIRLALYALRRQADNGPCSEPMPWPWDLVAHTKWKSWSQLGNMSKFEAMRLYCCTVEERVPRWWEEEQCYNTQFVDGHYGNPTMRADGGMAADGVISVTEPHLSEGGGHLCSPVMPLCSPGSSWFCSSDMPPGDRHHPHVSCRQFIRISRHFRLPLRLAQSCFGSSTAHE